MAAIDSQILLEEAKCYLCLGISLPEALRLALLSRIAENGSGSSGSGQLYTGAFLDPNGNVTPDNPTIANEYYQDINPPLNVWKWSVTDQVWYQHSG